jgi:transposase
VASDGTTGTLHDLLRQRVRVANGRAAAPTAAIIDSQSVKTSCDVGETSQGSDAGKKIKGRKRHIATDTLGLLLVAIVTAASVQGSNGGQQVLDQLAGTYPSVTTAWVDGGYNNTAIRHGAQRGIRVEVVKRPNSKGFDVLPRRWIVERTDRRIPPNLAQRATQNDTAT